MKLRHRSALDSQEAFTIIELLVVISIITLLAAVLFPVLQIARNRSKTAVCLSNLHQIGSAIALYASDHDDLMPYTASPATKAAIVAGKSVYGSPWDGIIVDLSDLRTVLGPYVKSAEVYRCPMDQIDEALAKEGGHKDTWFEECGSSYDYDDLHALNKRPYTSYVSPASSLLSYDISRFHTGMVNAVFADQHTKTISWEERTRAIETQQ